MIRIFLLICIGLANAVGAETPKAVVSEPAYDFGKVNRGVTLEHAFVLKNAGSAPLRILNARMSAPLVVTRMPAFIPPNGQAVLHFRLDTATLRGRFEGKILLTLNDPALSEASFSFEGNVIGEVELLPIGAFFVAGQAGEGKEARLTIVNHEPEPLRILAIDHSPERFTTKLETVEEGRRYQLVLNLKGNGPPGKATESILVRTSSQKVPLLRIPANTYLRDRVYTFPEVVDLGAVRIGDLRSNGSLLKQLTQTLMIYQVGGTSFRVKMSSDVPMLDIQLTGGPKGDRVQATIALKAEKLATGSIRGSLYIETNDPLFSKLTVPVIGLILEK